MVVKLSKPFMTPDNEIAPQEGQKGLKPEIIIENDYDGFFEKWTIRLAEELEKRGNRKIVRISVDAGPYRNSGVSYVLKHIQDATFGLHLDFYSAVRSGFGSIGVTQSELAEALLTK